MVSRFNPSWDDLKIISVSFIRSLLEQSCTVWHSGLTQENTNDLERVQKCALKIILKDSFRNYENALNLLDLESLEERRDFLCLSFAKKCLKNKKMKSPFNLNKKMYKMKTRDQLYFSIDNTNTDRLQNSPIIHMKTEE